MDTLKLSEFVGQEIVELRFHYVRENEYGLQSFHSYIKLSNDNIFDIPNNDDGDYLELNQDNLDYLKKMFDTGQKINDVVKLLFVGQRIEDFYFSYCNDEIDFDFSAFIKLSNNYYLTERNYGPGGLNINLIILDERQFKEEVERLNCIKVDVRSFTQTKNAC